MPYPVVSGSMRAVVFPDPVVEVRNFIRSTGLADRVFSRVPAGYEKKLPFVVVRESGGPGLYDRVFTRVRFQFECWAKESTESSDMARRLAGLLCSWDEYADVWNPRIIQNPSDMPDPDTGIPVHRLAVEVSFVGEEKEINNPLS